MELSKYMYFSKIMLTNKKKKDKENEKIKNPPRENPVRKKINSSFIFDKQSA